jgi:hypothetical protein
MSQFIVAAGFDSKNTLWYDIGKLSGYAALIQALATYFEEASEKLVLLTGFHDYRLFLIMDGIVYRSAA